MKVVQQQKLCLIMTLLLWACAAVTGIFYVNSKTLFPAEFLLQCTNILFVGGVVCVLAWRHSLLARQAFIEKRDEEESTAEENIFDNEGDFGGRYQQAFQQFNKIMLPAVLILISMLEVYLSARVLVMDEMKLSETPGSPLLSISVMLGLALILFLAGKFCSGLAFDEKHHFLRPVSACVLFGSLTLFIAAICALVYYFNDEIPVLMWFILTSCILSFVLAAERLLLWLVDLYRPKRKTDEYIPVYESRLLALFSHPKGVFGNLSGMLEYQFGIKVSESAFLNFAKKVFIPFVCIQLLTLLVLSSVTYIRPHENGLKQSWNSADFELLQPGLCLTAPWPLAKIERYDVQRIQVMDLNNQEPQHEDEQKDKKKTPALVDIWQDEKYESQISMVGDNAQQGNPSLAVVKAQLKYRISDALVYRSSFRNSSDALQMYARQILNRALLEGDFHSILRGGLFEFSQKLQKDIHAKVAPLLGVEVVGVEISNFQPPPQVAADYQKIFAEVQDGRRFSLDAEKYAISLTSKASIAADKLTKVARSETILKSLLYDVELAVFKAQRDSYNKVPLIYKAMARMNAIEEAVAKVRKLVNLTDAEKEVITLELKKISPDLMNLE
ncbi:MAG: hypothetical protein HRT88_04065 [Lentisphaeraceae bacterium]|nr:hypothetical protein [Lentisphaeraceae bacterium]